MTKDEALVILAPYAWGTPDHYFGHNPVGEYVVAVKNRGSSLLAEHNYEVIETALMELAPGDWDEAVMESGPVYSWRARHWACGWVDYLMVHPEAPDAVLIRAAELLKALAEYPILDEDAYGEKEYAAADENWACLSVADRVELCQKAGASVFAARHDWIPRDDSGFIFDRCRPD